MSSEAKVTIRPCTADDKDIVLATWLRGQYWGSDYFIRMNQDEYFQDYAEVVKNVICKPRTMIDVACMADAPTVVLGYIVYNDQKLCWGYVKRDYRKQGILNLLLKDMDFETYSGDTKVGHAIAKKKGLRFNPLWK